MPRWSPNSLARRRTGVGGDGHLQFLAQRPHRVVLDVVVRRLVDPHRRDHHPTEPGPLGPADLGEHLVELGGDRHERHPPPALGAVGTQLGEPPIVGHRPGEPELGVHVAGQSEARPERHARAALDRIGVGEDDLPGDTVAVELLVPLVGFPASAQRLLVLLEPMLGVVLVAHAELASSPRAGHGAR